MYGKEGGGRGGGGEEEQLIWERRVVSMISLLTGKLGQMPSKGNMRRLETKTQIYEKSSPFFGRILAVIGRYGPHLMIVMIFVTQNNFKNGPGISDRLLGFYQSYAQLFHLGSLQSYKQSLHCCKAYSENKMAANIVFCYDLANKEGNHDGVASSH